MNSIIRLADAIRNHVSEITFDRLYCIKINGPIACASQSLVILNDIHDRTLEQIIEEVISLLSSKGKYIIEVYYWSGNLKLPPMTRFMGKGDSFSYSPNPSGFNIVKLKPSIEIVVD